MINPDDFRQDYGQSGYQQANTNTEGTDPAGAALGIIGVLIGLTLASLRTNKPRAELTAKERRNNDIAEVGWVLFIAIPILFLLGIIIYSIANAQP